MRLKNYVAFDFEWNHQSGELLAAAFVDDAGKETVAHVSDFRDGEAGLIDWIKRKMLEYPLSVAYYSTGSESDLHVLNQRSIALGIQSIVSEERLVIEPVPGRQHVDLYRVFDKQVVKAYIYKKMYKSMKLNAIAKALLKREKTGEGKNVLQMSPEKVKEYCLNDARLTMDLSKVGDIDKKTKVAKLDGKLLDLMIALSERLNMPFTNVCHFGMSSMWHKVFREMGSRESDPLYLPNKIFPERRVKGAYVKDPEPGLYENVAVLDVASLYPTIMVKHNISFDTVCCECCRTNPAAKVPEDILPGGFWICKRKEGAVAQKIRQFREERLQHKRAGRKIMSDGIKILMNAMYGLFGNEFFEYADYRAANLVTAFGRSYIFKIIETAEKLGHKVLYSDTDSIFILQGTGPIDGIIEAVESELEGVELEHEKTYRKLLLTKKKHYIGLKVDDDPVVSGMEGEKNDRPQWIRETFAQFVRDFDADINPKTLLKASWEEFKEGQIPLEQLRFSIKLSKNGDQYEKGSQQNKLAMLAGAKAGDVIDYFKTPNGPSLQVQNFSELDFAAYKDTFESTFEDALSMLGIQISEIFEGHEQETLDTLFWRTTTA